MKLFTKQRTLVFTLIFLLTVLAGCGTKESTETEIGSDTSAKSGENPIVTITMENKDIIKLELYPDIAPNTIANFISLVEKEYYDGLIFHRVIPGFMIQGGDPNTKDPNKKSQWGMGGPEHTVKAEFSSRSHLEGIVSMARATDPDSAGSQFFIVTSDNNTESLDRQYTVFGEVIEGIDVAHKIENLPRDGNDCPKQEAKMLEVTISE